MRDPTTLPTYEALIDDLVDQIAVSIRLWLESEGVKKHQDRIRNDPATQFHTAFDIVTPAADDLLIKHSHHHDAGGARAALIEALGRGHAPARKRGQPQPPHLRSDRWIAVNVATICGLTGMNPTRNRESKKDRQEECGCSIVAKAFQKLGINKTGESGIAEIWRKHQKSLQPLVDKLQAARSIEDMLQV
jgi:hypothetical protein